MLNFNWSYVFKDVPELLKYVPVTLEIWILSILPGTLLGILFAIVRIKNVPVLTQCVRILISVVRGLPPLTQLFLFYYGLPQLLGLFGIDISHIHGMWFVIFAYGFSFGAILSENLRAAFASVGKGQMDAAYSIGMTGVMAFTRVLFPQALVMALPNYANMCIRALKNTSLAFTVGVIELMTRTQQIAIADMRQMESYVSLAVIYYGLYLVIRYCFNIAEKKAAFDSAE